MAKVDTTLHLFRLIRSGIGAIYFAVAVCAFTPLTVSAAAPAPTQPDATVNFSSAASSEVAAAVAEAGREAQGQVLDQLTPMIQGIGVILYVACIIVALTVFVLEGAFEGALWLLMGPPLFYFMVGVRAPSDGVDWQFGRHVHEGSLIDEAVEGLIGDPPNVSWFFSEYDRILSVTIQEIIRVISNNQVAPNLKFMVREQLLDELFQARIEEPGLIGLTRLNMANCAQEMDSARLVALGNRNANFQKMPEYTAAHSYFHGAFKEKRMTLTAGEDSAQREYLETLLDSNLQGGISNLQDPNGFGVYRQCLVNTQSRMNLEGYVSARQLLNKPFSCEELWCWMGLGIQSQVVQLQRDLSDRLIPKEADEAMYRQIWSDLAVRLTSQPEWTDAYGRDNAGVQPVQPDLSIIPVVLTGYLMKKMMTNDPRGENFAQLTSRSGISLQPHNFSLDMPEEAALQMAEHDSQYRLGEAKKYELFHYVMAMPYLQGALLYILAMTFPFFALMLLIPGKASAFFQWMGLWAWVKTWDIGWALTMQMEDILWNLMPHDAYYSAITNMSQDPITVFEAAFQGDPAYSLGNYYLIVGTLLTSVPMLTAEVLLGSKKVLAGTLLSGIQSFSGEIGNWAQDYARKLQSHETDWLVQSQGAKHAIQGLQKSIADGSNATPQTKQLHDWAKSYQSTGDGWKWAGNGLMAAGAVVGGLGALSVIGAGLGLTVGGALISAGMAARSSGFGMTRRGSERLAQRNYWNTKEYLWNFNDTTFARGQHARYSAATSRVEWWRGNDNVSEGPQKLRGLIKETEGDFYAYQLHALGNTATVGLLSAGKGSVTRGAKNFGRVLGF